MDLNEFWQENKRFVVTVAVGFLVFLIGLVTIHKFFGQELKTQRRLKAKASAELKQPMYTTSDLSQARDENKDLRSALGVLDDAVGFEARAEFQLDSGPPTNRYFAVVAQVREDLVNKAGRAGLVLPDAVGLPALSPTKRQEIERYLDALDVIDRVVHLAIDCGVERIERIQIKLDPRLISGKSIEGLEKTTVEVRLRGDSLALTELLMLSQEGEDPLLVERSEMLAATGKSDRARLETVFLAAQLHGFATETEIEE